MEFGFTTASMGGKGLNIADKPSLPLQRHHVPKHDLRGEDLMRAGEWTPIVLASDVAALEQYVERLEQENANLNNTICQMRDAADELHKCGAASEEEFDKLRAEYDKLREQLEKHSAETKDGVRVWQGDMVWHYTGSKHTRPTQEDLCRIVSEGQEFLLQNVEYGGEPWHAPRDECYSTKEAAEAAKEGK